MSKRLYITDIIGTGVREDPYRSIVASIPNPQGRNWVSVINISRFANSAGVLVASRSHTPYIPHPRITPMPDGSYDSLFALLDPAGRSTLLTSLAGRSFVLPSPAAVTYGQAVDELYRQIEPAFTYLNFDVFESITGGAAEPVQVTLDDGKPVWVQLAS